MGLHDAGFVDTITRGFAGDGVGVTCVDAEFVVEHWAANAGGDERVPTFVDDLSEAGAVVGFKVGGEFDHFVKFGLVVGWVPEDAVRSIDREVVGIGGLAQEGGAAVGWKKIQVFVDIVWGGVGKGVAIGWFGAPDLGGNIDDKSGGGWESPHGGLRMGRGA